MERIPQGFSQLFCGLLISSLLLVSCSQEDGAVETIRPTSSNNVPNNPEPPTTDSGYEIVSLGYSIPWGIDIIGDEEFLFTDRLGDLFHYNNGSVVEVSGIPPTQDITFSGIVYGGLMDVSLHPNFADNKMVYIAYVDILFYLSVARFELENNKAEKLEVIYKSDQFSIGSRIAWEDENHFFLSLGVGGSPYPDPGPQDLRNDLGKIHRLTADGEIPADNPLFVGQSEPSTVWSFGHRNPQGLYFDDINRTLYANEHGPWGGDELNEIKKGENYGWPLFSYGLNYDGTPVSDATEEEAAQYSELPLKAWDINFRVGPSGLIKLRNSVISEWNGSFLMGSLIGQDLIRYDPLTDETEIIIEDIGRVRDVDQLPNGELLILIDAGSPTGTDSGRILRISGTE